MVFLIKSASVRATLAIMKAERKEGVEQKWSKTNAIFLGPLDQLQGPGLIEGKL